MSRIRETFAALKHLGRGGFIPFITAGDPDLTTTELLLSELAAVGADIIELGVPFSDPVADGEVIQRASERALRNGVTLRDALTCIARARQNIDVPIVLFSYFNPLLKFGEIDSTRAGSDFSCRANNVRRSTGTDCKAGARVHLRCFACGRNRRERPTDQ